jgi:hypothetical protein
MSYLIGLIAALLGALYFKNSKAKSLEALLNDLKTGQNLNTKDQAIAQNNGALAAEEQKRKELENAPTNNDSTTDFFSNRK